MEDKTPKGTEFILTVPNDRKANGEKLTFYLKDVDEAVFVGAKALIDQKKDFDAVRMMIKALSLPGSSDVSKMTFVALQAATSKIIELITPLDAELKKN